MSRPRISVIHATARLPRGWKPAHDQALRNADHPERIEYVIGIDACDIGNFPAEDLPEGPQEGAKRGWGETQIVVNAGRRSSTDAYNEAAASCGGDLLFVMQDDIWCPEHWDTEVLRCLQDVDLKNDEAVLWVSSGSPSDDVLMAPQFVSRGRYQSLGYLWWPEYDAMYADNDLTEAAQKDNVVVMARNLLFEQKHPAFGTAPDDEVYRHENRAENYALGLRIFEERRRLGFPRRFEPVLPRLQQGAQRRLNLNVCLPGESFPSAVLANWTVLLPHLARRFNVRCYFGYNTDVYVCRNWFADQVRKQPNEPDDLVLWVDDDNVLCPEAFDLIANALLDPPEGLKPDAVAAWCWIYDQPRQTYLISCGNLLPSGMQRTLNPLVFDGRLEKVDYSGFPAVLHRCALLKVADKPFAHYPGVSGEDLAFWKRCSEAGFALYVHTGCRVPHLKRVALEPNIESMQLKDDPVAGA